MTPNAPPARGPAGVKVRVVGSRTRVAWPHCRYEKIRVPGSVQAVTGMERLRARITRLGADSDMRDDVAGHSLILYALVDGVVYLLSIRQHRQLSYDFSRLWPAVQDTG